MSRRKKKLPVEPVRVTIESMTHEGRGVAHVDGKAVFVNGVLPEEEVVFKYTRQNRRYDEAEVVEIITPSPHRVEPKCQHFSICGGCSLQHLDSAQQIINKQQVLMDNLQRIGKVIPEEVLPAMTGPVWGYRRKARLGAKHVFKKNKVLVGFREKRSGFLAELERCEVLHDSVGPRLVELGELIESLSCSDKIPQIEVAVADAATALVFRNLVELTDDDRQKLIAYAKTTAYGSIRNPPGPIPLLHCGLNNRS